MPTRRELLQLLVLLLIGWGVGQWLRSSAPLGRDVSANATAQAIMADSTAPRAGPAAADLTLVVFTDYQCPACRKADPAMRSAVTADRRVRVVYKDLPVFGPVSERGARVVLAAARQNIYPPVHHALMARIGPLDETALRTAVEGAGGDWRKIEDDLATHGRDIDQQLARTREEALALGIAGTPAYLVGDRLIIGAMTADEFADAFAKARRK